MDDCEYETLLYIAAETENADFDVALNGATLFLFNGNGAYLSSTELSAEDIAANKPVSVSYNRTNIPRAVVWANPGGATLVSRPSAGDVMENLFVSMAGDAGGYTLPADNLFFGSKRLSGAPVETVVINPKTGRITIAVRGLPSGDLSDQYYFTVASPYDSYDFPGQPLSGEAILNLPGTFQGQYLATPQAYHMFHFPSSGSGGESLTVSLYKTGAGSDEAELLAEAGEDADGEPLVITRERTTNVLIAFTGTGEIEVRVAVTGWGEIYQWDDW